MKFGIITPTFNRYTLLKRCINSVLKQTYDKFEIIIVDDSTDINTYQHIQHDFTDKRIKYIKNKKNSGVNFSRNVGMDNLSMDVDYVVFLDDDDFFDENTLKVALDIITKNNNYNWFISNKKAITKIENYDISYNYLEDYLLGKKVIGDVTHFLKYSSISGVSNKIRFSKLIKQGQEWLFFIEISEKNIFFTYNFDSTVSEYLVGGLSNQKRINIIISQILAIYEFLFLRKNSIKFKIKFLRLVLQKIKSSMNS